MYSHPDLIRSTPSTKVVLFGDCDLKLNNYIASTDQTLAGCFKNISTICTLLQ